MNDPTFNSEEIQANPDWELAFFMSEIDNDNAPIGWGKYIRLAKAIRRKYEMTVKGDRR